jgi:uncharacterized membrane protein
VNLAAIPGATAYARAYLCFAFVAILLFAFAIPPWQSPDEPAHFKRADQISRGGWLADRLEPAASGGVVSAGIDATVRPFVPMHFNPQVKATAEMFAQAEPVTWGNSQSAPSGFSNTALYPPVLYLPAAAAVLVGKLADLSIVSTLRLARIANGLVSVAIGTTAILVAGAAAPWIFALLALPTSLSVMASASHDGPMIALAALAAAILFNAYPGGRFAASPRAFVAMCGAVALVASARPIYAPLAILPLLVTGQGFAVRLGALAIIVAIVGNWSRIVAPLVLLQLAEGADPGAQLALLRGDPLNFFVVVARTVKIGFWSLLETFVGRLGWLDTALPSLYHAFARVELLAAAAATVAALSMRQLNGRALAVAAALVVACLALFLSLYLVWTRAGEIVVVGVQGRYLIPLAVFIPAAIPFAIGAAPPIVARAAFMALLAFPPISIAVTLFAVMQRYY